VNELNTKKENILFGLPFKYYMLHDTASRTEATQQSTDTIRHNETIHMEMVVTLNL
jgi:hypothetical protein